VEIKTDATILVHSKANYKGYYPSWTNRPVNPFDTGDLGLIDSEGDLQVRGRADRVFISGGENIHPELVESAIMATGLAGEVHCEGLPDPDWGQRIKVTVVPIVGDPDPAILLAALKRDLPPYAIPKEVQFVEKLPHTSTGKRLDSDA
jgi:acyl-CoA synthetase (AMP-forming)/AMP-acid ligase II